MSQPVRASQKTLASDPLLRLATLCAFYFAQGVPWGFVAITLVGWLAKGGASTQEIGQLMALSTLPWSFKWMWGPVIDVVRLPGGRRRPWIIIAQSMMALTMGVLFFFPGLLTTFAALGVTIFVHNCFNSLQDVAVDALAVDLLSDSERGRANGLMYGSKYLGGAVGGAGLGWVIATYGMSAALATQAVILVAILLLPLMLREGTSEASSGARNGVPGHESALPTPHARQALLAASRVALRRSVGLLADLLKAFSLRSTLLGAAFAVGAYIGAGVLSTVGAVLITQKIGWTAEHYAAVQGGLCLAFGLGGAVLGGFIADFVGPRRLVAIASTTLGALWIAFALAESMWSSAPFVTVVLVAESTLVAILSVGLFALFMQLAWPRVAATQFTAYMSLLNLSTTLGHAAAGTLDALMDYSAMYLVVGVVQIAIVALLIGIDPGQTRRELQHSSV